MPQSNLRSALLALLLLVSTLAISQTQLTDALPVAPEVKKGKLPNGLTYYIRSNGKPEKKVELRLVLKAGSILEDDDQQGLAHFTEHMAFNGTKNFKKNDLVSFLQSIGVEFGADLNAYTSFDETVYILPIPTDKPENLEKGFQVLEDWASTVTFENTEIDKERGVVLEESRLGKGANDRMNKVILPKLFEGSIYANRLPIGKDDILKNFKYDAIKRFYKDWYRPELMAVVAVGDIDPAQGEKMVKAHFEKLKNPAKPRARNYVTVPGRTKSEGVVVTDKEATNHFLQIYYSYKKSKPETTVGEYRTSLVKNIFNALLNQRLSELTQKPNPPYLFGATDLSGFVHGHEVFSSFAVLSKAGVEPAMNALMQESERARKFGFTANELDRSKKSMMRTIERAYNEREKTESENYADEYIRNFLEQEAIPGITNEYAYYKQYLETITLEEVNAYATATIPTQEARLIILNGPEKAEFQMPTPDQLVQLAAQAEKIPVTAYEEKTVASSLMDKLPTPGRIVEEKTNAELGYTDLTLSNQVRVILKPTDFKNDQVVMSATRFGGQSLYELPDKFNAAYATTVVSQMGVKEFSPVDLRKVFAGKTVNGSPRFAMNSEGFGGQSGSADVETLLQLTHLYFTNPRKDPDLFNSFVTKQQAFLQNMMSNPQTAYQDSVQKITYQNHPRAPRFPTVDDFNKINLDRALEIYKERFGNANGFTFFFVGSFDLNKMKELVATYLGSLPSAGSSGTYRDLGIRPVKGVVKKEVRKGTEQKSFITIQFNGETPYSDDASLKLQTMIEVLNIKLIETLREELSGVYGAGARGSMSKIPYSNYSITVSMPCGPENVDKLIKATFAEIQKLKDGPQEADLVKVKETTIKQYREDLKDNNYWLSKLQGVVDNGSNPADILTGEKRVNAVTVKDIQEAANKYFNMNNYLQVVLYPENPNLKK